jgi:hypothetical protein
MNASHRPVRGFEERLLRELRRVVIEESTSSSAPAAQAPIARGRFRWTRRLGLTGGLAAAVAIGFAAGLPIGGDDGGSAAYAVTQNADGTVTVEINALRDAEGLQRKLREAGVPALVQYLPPGKACEGARVNRSGRDPAPRLVDSIAQINEDGSIRFTIDKSAHPGQTLVVRTQDFAPGQPVPGQPGGAPEATSSAVGVSFENGTVTPCKVVDAADVRGR